MDSDDSLPDLLTLAQLKQVASTQPQPYRVQAQVENSSEKQTQQGKPYYEIKLTDGEESLIWRIFDGSPLFLDASKLARQAWIELGAQWVDTGKYGLEPKNAVMRTLTSDEMQLLLAGTEESRQRGLQDYGEIATRVAALQDPRLRGLADLFLQKFGERFRRTAAARKNHHARRGGLVEHVAQMMRSAAAICSAYPQLNEDLMIAGVLFHDCGKLWENAYADNSFTMPYSLNGEMLGHIPMGMELVNKLWRELLDGPESQAWVHLEPASEMVRLHLLHLIGSHHGEYAFGAPVLPKTPEAVALHHVDNIDAKLEMFRRGYETGNELGNGIYERVFPLAANLVTPLSKFTAPPAAEPTPQ
ncbi:MAG: hypothetical protein JWO08_2537 [Verrucomicrobiaceae bacterium]|nr:hypothetical protein [Verrucomicrobiaceae bacterium]